MLTIMAAGELVAADIHPLPCMLTVLGTRRLVARSTAGRLEVVDKGARWGELPTNSNFMHFTFYAAGTHDHFVYPKGHAFSIISIQF
jgi:hypothetical protein